jgi:hypothetical protein
MGKLEKNLRRVHQGFVIMSREVDVTEGEGIAILVVN